MGVESEQGRWIGVAVCDRGVDEAKVAVMIKDREGDLAMIEIGEDTTESVARGSVHGHHREIVIDQDQLHPNCYVPYDTTSEVICLGERFSPDAKT
eukprot:g67970.t1